MCGIVGASPNGISSPSSWKGCAGSSTAAMTRPGLAVLNGSKHLTRLRTVGKVKMLEEALEQTPTHGQDRHRAHPLGDPRRAERAQRPSAHLARRPRDRAQRHHREPRASCAPSSSASATSSLRDRYRGHRAPHSPSPGDRGRSVQGGARHGRRARGRLRAGGGERARSGPPDPRARGLPGGHRPGRRRKLRRLGRRGAAAGDAPVHFPRGG